MKEYIVLSPWFFGCPLAVFGESPKEAVLLWLNERKGIQIPVGRKDEALTKVAENDSKVYAIVLEGHVIDSQQKLHAFRLNSPETNRGLNPKSLARFYAEKMKCKRCTSEAARPSKKFAGLCFACWQKEQYNPCEQCGKKVQAPGLVLSILTNQMDSPAYLCQECAANEKLQLSNQPG